MVIRICDHWSTVQTHHGSFLSIHASLESVYSPPLLHFEPPQLLHFEYDADPDPAFHNKKKKGMKTRKEGEYTATRYGNYLNLKRTETEIGDNIYRPGEEVSLTHL